MNNLTRLLFCTLFLAVSLPSWGQNTALLNKTWAYKRIAIALSNDTLILYHSDSTKNIWYLGKVSFTFKSNNTYQGTDIDGLPHEGTWSVSTDGLVIVDRDTNRITTSSATTMSLISDIDYQDSLHLVRGKLITVLYAIPPVVSSCQSLQSGDWSTASTWSCGHEPTIADLVIINPSHLVTVSTSSAQAQRLIHNGGVIQFTIKGASIFVKGSD